MTKEANCKFCYRPITKAVLAEKRRRKVENALASLKKMRANGKRGGRKRTRDDNKIRALRRQGLSIRAIALLTNCSTTAVQRSLKEALKSVVVG